MQPGPQEVLKRNKRTSTFYMYLALTPYKSFQRFVCIETRGRFDFVNIGEITSFKSLGRVIYNIGQDLGHLDTRLLRPLLASRYL